VNACGFIFTIIRSKILYVFVLRLCAWNEWKNAEVLTNSRWLEFLFPDDYLSIMTSISTEQASWPPLMSTSSEAKPAPPLSLLITKLNDICITVLRYCMMWLIIHVKRMESKNGVILVAWKHQNSIGWIVAPGRVTKMTNRHRSSQIQ
jgi:hypothetical protein